MTFYNNFFRLSILFLKKSKVFFFCFFSPVRLFPLLAFCFCAHMHIMKNTESFLVVWEYKLEKKDSNRDGYNFFRSKRQPHKRKITARNSQHPFVPEKSAQAEKNVTPSVCYDPGNTETKNKARVENQKEQFFKKCFQFLFVEFQVVVLLFVW